MKMITWYCVCRQEFICTEYYYLKMEDNCGWETKQCANAVIFQTSKNKTDHFLVLVPYLPVWMNKYKRNLQEMRETKLSFAFAVTASGFNREKNCHGMCFNKVYFSQVQITHSLLSRTKKHCCIIFSSCANSSLFHISNDYPFFYHHCRKINFAVWLHVWKGLLFLIGQWIPSNYGSETVVVVGGDDWLNIITLKLNIYSNCVEKENESNAIHCSEIDTSLRCLWRPHQIQIIIWIVTYCWIGFLLIMHHSSSV